MYIRNVSDEYLIFLMRANSKEAYKLFVERYKFFILGVLNKHRLILKDLNIEWDHAVVELQYATEALLMHYEYCAGYFYSYWHTGILRELYAIFRRHKRIVEESEHTINLDESFGKEGENEVLNHEVYGFEENDYRDPGQDLLLRISDNNEQLLNLDEKYILVHIAEGYSVSEIARISNKTNNTIRRHLRNVRRKLSPTYGGDKKSD